MSILLLGGCGEAGQGGGTGSSTQSTPEGEAAETSGGYQEAGGASGNQEAAGTSGGDQELAGASGGSQESAEASGENQEAAGTSESQEDNGQSEESRTGQTGDGQAEADSLPEGYRFQAGSVTLMPDMDIDTVLEQLGESSSVYEAPSCAGQGISYLYDYTSYEIETYPAEGGVNRIGYIILKDDTVATSEGVDLSMTRADCIEVYGEPYEEKENKLVYVQGNTKLNFILEGEYIVSIEYASGVIG